MSNLSSQKMMEALLLLLKPPSHNVDAIFIHGSSVKSDELDSLLCNHAISLVKKGVAPLVLVNGLPDRVCQGKNLAYAGADTWKSRLSRADVPVLQIPGSLHTPAECDNLIKFAGDQGWQRIEVISSPHHLLRCAAQMVFCLKRAESSLQCFYSTIENVRWHMSAVKPVLGGGVETGSFFDHIAVEFQRFVKYSDTTGEGYTPNASLEELIEYLQNLYAV